MSDSERGTDTGIAARDESSRERILAAAQDLFARNGFDATPTSHIAERAEVPKGLVHYYFNRKPDLLIALVDKLPAEPIDLSTVVTPGDLAGSLRTLVQKLDAMLDSSSLLSHLLWREADTHESVREAMQDRYRTMVGQIREVIATSSPEPIEPDRVEAAAALLAHALSYRHSVARHDGGPCETESTTMEAEMEFVAEALLR